MSSRFLTFFCQHAFNILVRFGEGRFSCVIFIFEVLMEWLEKWVSTCSQKHWSFFKFSCKCSCKSFALFWKEAIFFYVSQASVTSWIIFLMLFSTRALEDARRVEDTFILAVVVSGMFLAKGLANSRVAMKSSSNSLTQSFSLAFSASIPPMEWSRASLVTWWNREIWDSHIFLKFISMLDFPFLFVTSLFSMTIFLDWL